MEMPHHPPYNLIPGGHPLITATRKDPAVISDHQRWDWDR